MCTTNDAFDHRFSLNGGGAAKAETNAFSHPGGPSVSGSGDLAANVETHKLDEVDDE